MCLDSQKLQGTQRSPLSPFGPHTHTNPLVCTRAVPLLAERTPQRHVVSTLCQEFAFGLSRCVHSIVGNCFLPSSYPCNTLVTPEVGLYLCWHIPQRGSMDPSLCLASHASSLLTEALGCSSGWILAANTGDRVELLILAIGLLAVLALWALGEWTC